jgi:acyl homoserine lactone synthase
MIRFLYADQLSQFPILADSMFRDRAEQFRNRLNWKVTVNDRGWELDEYDALNPLYVIWEEANGRHGGSMRTLPTVGRTMIAEHFRHLTHGVRIASPFIWECTRFCLSPTASQGVAAGLLLAGCEMGLRFGLEQAVGVFDARMPRIYGRIGWMPEVIGTGGAGHDSISVGLWNITEEVRAEIAGRAGIPLGVVAHWFDLSFNANLPLEAAA